jgi:hypothetical protein
METLNTRAARDTRIIRMQAQLLDHSGHVTRGLSRDDARILLDEVNFLRERNGWQPLDMTGRRQRRR